MTLHQTRFLFLGTRPDYGSHLPWQSGEVTCLDSGRRVIWRRWEVKALFSYDRRNSSIIYADEMLQSRGEIDAAGKTWENENALESERSGAREMHFCGQILQLRVGVFLITSFLLGKSEIRVIG